MPISPASQVLPLNPAQRVARGATGCGGGLIHLAALCAVSAALALPVQAQTAATTTGPTTPTATTGAPADFKAPALPADGETNAQRASTQPGNNAPFWRSVRDSGEVAGVTNLPGAEKGVLIQGFTAYPGTRYTTAGEAWRTVRNQWIIPYGGSLLLIVVLALALFYFAKGPLGHKRTGGRQIERFTPFERAAHWANAGAFVVLAISGLTMAFGKFVLLPILGHALFGWLTYVLKTVHNFVGPLFAVSLVIIVFTFVKDNIASRADFVWLKTLGGMLSDKQVPSHRFNAGEKGMFWWGMTIPGLIIIGSGLVLDLLIPGWGETRGQMQVAHMLHAAGAIWMMAALLGHIYMGTIGMHGALKAMKTGYVDEAWASEHHELWLDDVKQGKIPAQRSGRPAPASVSPASVSPARPATSA